MATNIRKASKRASKPGPERRCRACRHLESEHGTTGMHPCLAMVGDLLDREFCPCDEFRIAMSKAA
jgi:hypothetical protein